MAVKSWKIALSFGLPWSIFMFAFGTVLQGTVSYLVVVSSFVAGAFAGWVFSILIRYAASSLYESIVVEIASDESMVKQGGARHLVGEDSIGGKLVLTDKQLIFKSHTMNTLSHQYVIYLDQIGVIKTARTFGVVRSGLSIILRNNQNHRFYLQDSKTWISAIESEMYGSTIKLRKSTLLAATKVAHLSN